MIGAIAIFIVIAVILISLCINSGRISRQEENKKWRNKTF